MTLQRKIERSSTGGAVYLRVVRASTRLYEIDSVLLMRSNVVTKSL